MQLRDWQDTDSASRERREQPRLYIAGIFPPHYPVPATMDNAVLALYHSPQVTVWSIEWFKRELRRA